MAKHIIALGLLTREDLEKLGPQFMRAYPINDVPCLGELLNAIDLADRELWRARDQSADESGRTPPSTTPQLIITRCT